ncbi:MAG TPA: PQQ-binding-like beta-propeller repeat protein [Planctomycetaceae bacterium]|nr:PQQ-binding-like beta-propeller repeat protein [Planctomycetaceae bacterium]
MREGVFLAPKRAKRKEARGLVPLVARVLSVGLSLLVASAAIRASAGLDDPAPQGEPPVEEATEEVQSREQRMLRQAVFRDRTIQCALDEAESALRIGEINRAVAQLQQVLDQPGDHFIWIPSEHRLASARRRALDLLSAAGGKTREFYDWVHATEAQRLLERGLTASEPAVVAEVARRFFHTASGFEATNWLATRWLDRGEYALAARAWRLLAADPCHRKRVDAKILRKVRVAERLCGGESLADRGMGTRSSDSISAGPDPRELNREGNQAAAARSVDLAALDEGVASDQPSRGQRVENARAAFESFAAVPPGVGLGNGSSAIPYMTPTWRVDLIQPKNASSSEISDLVRRWERQSSQRDDKRPVAVQSALAVGGALVLRDYSGFRALDINSGRELWTYGPTTSLARALAETELPRLAADSNSSHETPHDVLMGAYAANSILGTLTTDGRRVFAVDSMDFRPRQPGVPMDETGETQHGSQRLSRNANRLIALEVHNPARDAAGLVKPVWTVGGAVGTSHWFYRMDANDDGRITQAEFLGTPEQFKQLDSNGDGSIDAKEAERAGDKIEQQPLHGHFFLGPPLALDGRLYAITECDCQLNLVALSAANGAVLWVQGIGYVDRPIDEEPLRYTLACTPASGGGVIVCPTQAGMLVGVDALDGALLWTYYCADEDGSGTETSWSFACRHAFGNPGFPNVVLVEGNQVVVLPRQSEAIQCLDLSTGRGIWKKPRGDGEFVAAAADGVVMVVGERLCRGLSLADGAERWSTRIGESCGSGVRLGGEYLIPLADNRIAAIDIRTGMRSRDLSTHDEDNLEQSEPQRNDFRRDFSTDDDSHDADGQRGQSAPGNLVAAGSLIVSCGSREIVAYPRAESLLERVQQRLASGPPQPSDLALAADLELALGQVSDAKAYLSQIAARGLPDESSRRAERLKRTVLIEELSAGCARPADRLHELESLSQTPTQRFRFLQAKSEVGIRAGDLSAVFDATRAFGSLGNEGLLTSQNDQAFLVSARAWLAATDERVRHSFSNDALKIATSRIGAQQRAALQSNDCGLLERFLAVYGNWPEADLVRLRLADVAASSGQWQRSELLLLCCEHSPRPETARAAQRRLVLLWDRVGLAEEAADLLIELEKQESLENRDPSDTQRLVGELRRNGLTRRAWARLKSAERPFGRARLSQTLWEHCNNDLAEKYTNASRPGVTRAASAFQLIDAGTANEPKVNIVDRLSGTVVGELEIPAHYWGLTLAATSQVGHFIPLGSRASFHGISLLERDSQKPFWTNSPARIARDPDAALVGPTGPSFCTFQSHRHLFVVDPATGKLLWHRTDLDPQSGLVADPNRGIFGDDEALVVLGSDHLSYTVYRTATGEELRQGSLDSTTRQIPERRAFGRCLLYFTSHEGSHRMRLWDPLTDRLLYDAPISERLLWKETGEDEVAVITAGGAMQIVDGHTGAVRVDLKLDAREFQNLSQVSAFRDANCYYVNLQPMQTIPEPRRYAYCFGTDTTLPHADLRGNLVAIERRSGQVLWKRAFAQRTVLRVPTLRLPVLVMVALVGDRLNGNHRSMLVEVIDAKTGETLAFDDDRFPNHILQMTYDDDHRRIRLWGTRSVVDVDFASHGSRLAAETSTR